MKLVEVLCCDVNKDKDFVFPSAFPQEKWKVVKTGMKVELNGNKKKLQASQQKTIIVDSFYRLGLIFR